MRPCHKASTTGVPPLHTRRLKCCCTCTGRKVTERRRSPHVTSGTAPVSSQRRYQGALLGGIILSPVSQYTSRRAAGIALHTRQRAAPHPPCPRRDAAWLTHP